VGAHPAFAALSEVARQLAAEEAHSSAVFLKKQAAWDPFAFVDLCEAAASGRAPCELLCRQIQQHEWEILFDFCYRQAVGEGK
jgi:hypothetical protein